MLKLFIGATSAVFDWLLAPFGLDLWVWNLIFWPVIGGVIALLVYKKVSNQKGIERAKNGIYTHLMEVVLYQEDVVGVVVSTTKAMVYNALYLGHNILPMIVMLLPMATVMTQLVANHAYAPLTPDQPILLDVQLAEGASVKATDVKLTLPDGVKLDAPPARSTDGHVIWRLVPSAGDWTLSLDAGGVTETKGLAVGGGDRKVPIMRTNTWEAFLYPGEPALSSDSPFETIKVKYPDRKLPWLPDGEGGILIWFFGLSLGAGFALKDYFGVTL